VVAVDGRAGTGKSTVARRLAAALGVPYLDTGAMYRAMTLHALEHGVDPDDRERVARMLPGVRLELRLDAGGRAEVLLDGAPVEPRIRTPEVAAATSRLAVHPEVRERMVSLQRELAERHGGVLEGRDVGTRVFPEARFKFFLEASREVRAERRLADLRAAGHALSVGEVESQLDERDRRDRERSLSPLAPAADAVLIDTSTAGVDEIVDRLTRRVRGG
jgi:cytidylate kinase